MNNRNQDTSINMITKIVAISDEDSMPLNLRAYIVNEEIIKLGIRNTAINNEPKIKLLNYEKDRQDPHKVIFETGPEAFKSNLMYRTAPLWSRDPKNYEWQRELTDEHYTVLDPNNLLAIREYKRPSDEFEKTFTEAAGEKEVYTFDDLGKVEEKLTAGFQEIKAKEKEEAEANIKNSTSLTNKSSFINF